MNVVPAVQADTLNAVTVIADRGVVVSKSETVKLKSTISITDALEAVPGITLGDYGGFAGLKTVSLRGLGSAHTAIYIDGVRLGNISSGQADLGNFDFGGFAGAVIDYAQNSLSFVTAKPVFDGSPFAGISRSGAAPSGPGRVRVASTSGSPTRSALRPRSTA